MHNAQSKYGQYSATEVTTANRLRLLIMLYDGAIRFVETAKQHLAAGRISEKGLYIGKALAIIAEFKNTLDFQVGGDVPHQLQRLYVFVEDRLVRANVHNDAALLDEARHILEILRSAWVELEERGVASDPLLQRQGSPRGGPDAYFKISV